MLASNWMRGCKCLHIGEAATKGHWYCIKEFIDRSGPYREDFIYSDNPADQLQWVINNRPHYGGDAVALAARNGHIHCIQLLIDNNYPKCESATASAAINGHTYCIQWLVDNGFPKHCETAANALKNNQMECFQWLIDNGFPKKAHTTGQAAGDGDIKLLQRLIDNGFPKSDCAIMIAAKSGHIECVEWLINHGFSGPTRTICRGGCRDKKTPYACIHYLASKGFLVRQSDVDRINGMIRMYREYIYEIFKQQWKTQLSEQLLPRLPNDIVTLIADRYALTQLCR